MIISEKMETPIYYTTDAALKKAKSVTVTWRQVLEATVISLTSDSTGTAAVTDYTASQTTVTASNLISNMTGASPVTESWNQTLTGTALNLTSNTTLEDAVTVAEPWKVWLIGLCLVLLTFVTLAGNLFVIAAFIFEKKLQTPFNIYIVNLAFTDFLTGLIAMPINAAEILLGYWPFDDVRFPLFCIEFYCILGVENNSCQACSQNKKFYC